MSGTQASSKIIVFSIFVLLLSVIPGFAQSDSSPVYFSADDISCYSDSLEWLADNLTDDLLSRAGNAPDSFPLMGYDNGDCRVSFYASDSGDYRLHIEVEGESYDIIADNIDFDNASLASDE